MKLINFRLSGRFAHFLRAEASTNALSYPVPPRTVILGIIGAVLGLPKDQPQAVLEPANTAISGKLPITHWHRVNLRKDPPAMLPYLIKNTHKSDKNTAPEKTTRLRQEWLFEPTYDIWCSIPEPYHGQLEERLRDRQWHFTPSLGLSEMMADIEYLGSDECEQLPKGIHNIQSVCQQQEATLEMDQIFKKELSILSLHMPRTVTFDRVFSHCAYFLERDAMPIPVETERAYRVNGKVITFL